MSVSLDNQITTTQASAYGAKDQSVGLDDATEVSFGNADIHDIEDRRKNSSLRRGLTLMLVSVFLFVVLLTTGIIGWMAYIDQQDLANHLVKPGERIVTTGVLMSMLGATVVELRAIVAATMHGLTVSKPVAADTDKLNFVKAQE